MDFYRHLAIQHWTFGVGKMNKKLQQLREKVNHIKQNRVKTGKIEIFRFKPFSKKQKQVLTWWSDNSSVKEYDGIIADGSIRSGKTVCMSLAYVMWAMFSFNGQNFGMCGKTIGSFRRNVLFWLKIMLRCRGYHVKDHRSDNLVIVTKHNVSNYFYIFGGKDESSQDLIQGITLAGVFFDEVALMPESFVNQATGRCSVTGSKYWFNCNPDGPYHWFKTHWIDRSTGYLGKQKVEGLRKQQTELELKNILYVHFTMDDNLSLSDEIKKRYFSMYTGVFFKRYILGLWAMAEGIIYDMFLKEKHMIDTQELARAYKQNTGRDFWTNEQYVSCDYGTQNPTVFLLWTKANNQKWYCRKEYYYSGREKGVQKTDEQFSKDLKEWLGKEEIRYILLDPSAASFKAQLKKDGFQVKKAKNEVLDGIRLVATLLNQNAIFFDCSCIHSEQEFASYIWDEKAADRGEDKPVKEHDHCMDAIRYFVYTVIRKPSSLSILK